MVVDTASTNGKVSTKDATKIVSPAASEAVNLLDIKIKHILLPIRGTSPLIMHKWSEKAKKAMLDKQMKKASGGREAKNPEQDYEESIYYLPNKTGYGFPAVAFKAAAVAAGRYCDLKMTFLRGAFHVDGELVEITGTPQMREDMVRVGMGTADIRYRAEFVEWSALLPISLNESAINTEQIANLFRIAGFAVGVGEWRPEKDGQYGRFDVNTKAVVEKD